MNSQEFYLRVINYNCLAFAEVHSNSNPGGPSEDRIPFPSWKELPRPSSLKFTTISPSPSADEKKVANLIWI